MSELATIFPPDEIEKDHRGNGGLMVKNESNTLVIISGNYVDVKRKERSSAITHLLTELRTAHLQLAVAQQQEQFALCQIEDTRTKLEYFGLTQETIDIEIDNANVIKKTPHE